MTFKHMANNVQARIEGRTYSIPQAWLAGATYTREREGMTAAEAYANAIATWHEQALMEEGSDAGR